MSPVSYSRLSASTVRRIRLLAALVIGVAVVAIVWQLLEILLPFLLSAAIAYLLMPVVRLADRMPWAARRPHASRAVAAGLVTVLVIAGILVLLAIGIVRVVDGSVTLAERAPGIIAEARAVWDELQHLYRSRVPANIQDAVDPRLIELRAALINAGIATVQRVSRIAQSGVSQVISLAAAPIILFYLLYQPVEIGRGVRNLLPGPLRDDLVAMGALAGESIGAYLRMQLLLALLVGTIVAVALWLLRVPLALPLGIFAGLAELVPIVGPTVFTVAGGIVVALIDVTKLPYLLVIYLLVQVLQNTVLSPRLQGQALGLHPLAVILALAVFGLFFGFLGTLLATPLTAAGFRVLTYTRREWASAGDPGGSLPPADADSIPAGTADGADAEGSGVVSADADAASAGGSGDAGGGT